MLAAAIGLIAALSPLAADEHVAVVASAKPEYTQRKYENGKPRPETYVFMQGSYFDGTTADSSIETMSFRRIAEFLAPQLAHQQYFPTTDPRKADLLLVVHWGTTVPRVTVDEMRAHTTTSFDTTQEKALAAETKQATEAGTAAFLSTADEADRQLGFEYLERLTDTVDQDMAAAGNAKLLGYSSELRRMQKSLVSDETEATLRSDLAGERYFVIIKAYDLKEKLDPGQTRKAAWTLHLNIRSPGHSFPSALDLMGNVAVDYFGRTTDGVRTSRPSIREGKVSLAPIVILGEEK